jgi:hypothetical protein
VQIAGRPVESDVSAGDWIAGALHDSSDGTVSSLVPPVFEAYARVFHPAVRYPDDELPGSPSDDPDVDVSWAEVAAYNGRTAHPAMEWASITGSWDFVQDDDQPGVWNGAPALGHLPSQVAASMAAVLSQHTGTPSDCWFGVDNTWHGDARPALRLYGIEHLLVRGPVDLAAANVAVEPVEQSAQVWWPDDRAWCVVTHPDLMSTYVGGSAACITDLLAAAGIEAARVRPEQLVTWDADTVNPAPFGARSS